MLSTMEVAIVCLKCGWPKLRYSANVKYTPDVEGRVLKTWKISSMFSLLIMCHNDNTGMGKSRLIKKI